MLVTLKKYLVVVFQLLSCSDSLGPFWTARLQASLSFTNSQIQIRLMSIELMMPSNHLILCCPLLLLLSIFPSIRIFSNELALCIWWLQCQSLSISPSNEYSGMTFFRVDWFDLLAVQGTLKSLLQHHSLKASILQHSAFLLLLLLLSLFSRVRLCATPQTAAHQGSLSLGFSRQEHWSVLPFPSPMHESER